MSAGFQTPITVKDAIDNIFHKNYLLPAIQRKFTWTSSQIELLFDSIMRDYPINSFMFWKVSSEKIKNDYKFYEFITSYREFFKENNPDVNTTAVNDFFAVIDGQQRLTSLYIGLRGTYAYKEPRKWWIDNEDNIPTRELYLNLSNLVDGNIDSQKKFDFTFLTKDVYEKKRKKSFLFKVKDILKLDTLVKVNGYLHDNSLINNEFASETLIKLHEKIHKDKLINYYLEDDQESDKVLEIFIRTNSGGTSLSFSDLLMSISSANWERLDAREEMEKLIKEVYSIGKPGFMISKDFILKTCLFIFSEDIKFQLKNFHANNIKLFEDNWEKVRKSIVSAFLLFEKLGFNDVVFRAKNAAIPIIYYIYKNNLCDKITQVNYSKEDKKNISKWLNLSFLKSIFGGHSDSILTIIRTILKNSHNDFPFFDIVERFKKEPSKTYNMDDEFVDGLLQTQYEKNEAFYILSMLYPNLDYYNQDFHMDHLHPQSFFEDKELVRKTFSNEDDITFALDKNNWNSILNLQLLNSILNSSKKDKPLSVWAKENKVNKRDLFVDDNIDLSISNFRSFINNRKDKLKEKIKSLV